MRSRRFAATVLAAVGCFVFHGRPAHAGAWSLAPGEYVAEISGSFFSSATTHDANGDRVALSAPGLMESRAGRARVELGWKKRLSVQMGVPFTNVTRTQDAPTPAAFQQTATGLGDFDFGLRWALANGANAMALQVGWSAPLGYNRDFLPSPGTGHSPDAPRGLQTLSAGLVYGAPLGNAGFFELGGGYAYRYRTIGGRATGPSSSTSLDVAERTWADHVTATGTLALWFGEHLQVAGRYDGRLAVDQGDRHPEVSEHLVGPRVTYRVDDKLDAFAGSWHTAAAEQALHVNEFYCGVTFRQSKLKRNQGLTGGIGR